MRNSFIQKVLTESRPVVDPKIQALDGRIRAILGGRRRRPPRRLPRHPRVRAPVRSDAAGTEVAGRSPAFMSSSDAGRRFGSRVAAGAHRRHRSRAADAAEQPCPRRPRDRRAQARRRLAGVPARARSCRHRRPEDRERGPVAVQQRGADLARDHVGVPRARDADASRLPRARGHLQRAGDARLLRLVDRPAPVCQRRRGVPFDELRAPRNSASCRSRTRAKAWSRARSTCSSTTPARHRRRDEPLRAAQPAALERLAGRHRGRLRPPAGAGAVPRLAQPAPAAGRATARCQQCRGRPTGQPRRQARRHRQRASRQRVRPARRRAGDPGRRAQPHSFRRPRRCLRAPGTQGVGTRLHESRGLGREPAGRGARPAPAAEGARRLDDPFRVPPRPARASGSTTSTSTSTATPSSRTWRWPWKELRAACAFFKLLGAYPVDAH